jgi:hypothetical protein
VILFVQVSLDGFFEGPKKEIDWHMIDDELHAHVVEEIKAMGACFLLRRGRSCSASPRPGRSAPESPFSATNDSGPLGARIDPAAALRAA